MFSRCGANERAFKIQQDRALSDDVAIDVLAAQRRLRGLLLDRTAVRYKPARDLAAHMLLHLDDLAGCWSIATGWLQSELRPFNFLGYIVCKSGLYSPTVVAKALRAAGAPAERLARWLEWMQTAYLIAMGHLDDIEAWLARAATEMSALSAKTPPALRDVVTDWPLISAPMAEALTGASRAAVQRNLDWMEARGLIREVTGYGRYRMWRAAN